MFHSFYLRNPSPPVTVAKAYCPLLSLASCQKLALCIFASSITLCVYFYFLHKSDPRNTGVYRPNLQSRRVESSSPVYRSPSRPDNLSSYYPGVTLEGSGAGEARFINTLGDVSEADLIAPTRSSYPAGPSSSVYPAAPSYPPTNHQPFISNRLNKLSLIAGKSSRIIIPANTFQDLEDGDTRDLSLRIVEAQTQKDLNTLGWIQYNQETQELVALPLESEHGTWKFKVIATDSGGESVVEILEILVRQHSGSRVFNHQFNLTLKPGVYVCIMFLLPVTSYEFLAKKNTWLFFKLFIPFTYLYYLSSFPFFSFFCT